MQKLCKETKSLIHFGAAIVWPREELQFLVLLHWLHFSAPEDLPHKGNARISYDDGETTASVVSLIRLPRD